VSVGDGVGLGPVLVVPEAAGVDGGGVGVGDTGGTDAVGVGVAVPVGLTVGVGFGELTGGRTGALVDPPVVGARLTVGVGRPPCRVLVGVGVWVTPGAGGEGSSDRRAATSVPMRTRSTRPTSAISGNDAERPRRRTPPVRGEPGSGRGAVCGRPKRSGPPGGVAPESSAPLAAAVPGAGTPPLAGGMGATPG
jgi:hypothetical protein